MRKSLFRLVLAAFALTAPAANAFCGFYVARADGELYNKGSMVVYTRSGNTSVITMSSDYTGSPAEFAMIVPTPKVLNRDQVTTVPADTVEVWRFINATGMAHPMHVHGVKMSILSRGGSPPASHEQGIRDTFVVEAMQTVAVAVQTAAQASSVPLMFHCHILEHEDAGMMGQFVTV